MPASTSTLFPGFDSERLETSGAEIHLVHAGDGPPLLLLHGYPQTHAMWHKVAPALAQHFHVVCADLRGYGDSAKPPSTEDHFPYSKRAMARDMIEVMHALGYDEFSIAGHDRGGRVAHRMALDHAERLHKICVMDIAPTRHMFLTADREFATGYYHWFFLIQPNGLPEHLIGLDPEYYVNEKMKRWSAPASVFTDDAMAEYVRCFTPETIHASCEDYRAAATIDLEHDEADCDRRIECPLLVLWGSRGFVHKRYDVLAIWRDRASRVEGRSLDCGHFLAEEDPDSVVDSLTGFFSS